MRRGFTLIELLIVVAIIAILAAIAVPNFLEAQTRSKVSRAKADMRTLATGLESYMVDANCYPKCNANNCSSMLVSDPGPVDQYQVLEKLSTPIAYLSSSILRDPFFARSRSGAINFTDGSSTPVDFLPTEREQETSYKYLVICEQPNPTNSVLAVTSNLALTGKLMWSTWSAGPTLVKPQISGTTLLNSSVTPEAVNAWIYDPTNGTVSRGGVFRVGGSPPATNVTNPFGPNDAGAIFFREVSRSQK